jgi:hypothetical protein
VAIGVNASVSTGETASVAATTTITLPPGTAATDVVVVVFGSDTGGTTPSSVTAPAGWTAINTAFTVTISNTAVRLAAFWALGSVANLGFTNSLTGTSYQQGWACVGFTGVDNTTPVDATAATNSSTGSTTLTTNAVTIATTGAWHCIPICSWNGTANEFGATNFTFKEDAATQASAALGYNTNLKSIGSTGTVAVTSSSSGTGQILAAMPFALRPDAGGGGAPAGGGASTGVGIQHPVARGWL